LASKEWQNVYLVNATKRLNSHGKEFHWTIEDAHAAQSLCAYETVALGYSAFCGLFNFEEWEGYVFLPPPLLLFSLLCVKNVLIKDG
jgi:hypothetical protein